MTSGEDLTAVWKLGTPDRLATLRESIAALTASAPATDTIVLAGDAALRERVREQTPADRVADAPRSVTVSRNQGVRMSNREYVAFFDDDAVPLPCWWPGLKHALDDADAAVAGGPLVPRWETTAPRWLPESFHWLIGCGPYYDTRRRVANTYGSNLVVERDAFEAVGGFDESIGMGSGGVGQAAEPDLCRRLRDAGYTAVVYLPAAEVEHVVTAADVAPRTLVRRALEQGWAKAHVGVGDREATFLRDELGREGRLPTRVTELVWAGVVGLGYLAGRVGR